MKKSYLLLHSAVILAGFTGVFGKLIFLMRDYWFGIGYFFLLSFYF